MSREESGKFCRARRVVEDESWSGEMMQRIGEGKRLIEDLPERNEFGARIPADALRQVPVRGLKDERR